MRSFTYIAVGALGVIAAPASAAIVLCSGNNCVSTNENVLVTAATGAAVGSPIFGQTNNTNVGVTFTSATDRLVGNSNGQADVSSFDGLLNSLTFQIGSGFGFTSAIFNLFPLPGNANNEATEVLITYYTPGLGSQTRSINTNGQNFIGISGNAGEVFTSVGFAGSPITFGIQDMRQLRLGGVQSLTAVPEPATWAMFIVGFGVLGLGLRRRTAAMTASKATLSPA